MNSIVYVGMDVHKESYTLCCYCYDTDKVEYKQTIPSDYKLILKYMESMRLSEYIVTYEFLTEKIERLDHRIEELASGEKYKEKVKNMGCFLGIKTHTALSMVVEIGDFNRFEKAPKFAGFLGLVPSENSSGDDRNRYSITKAGNSHLRRLMVEAAQSYTRAFL